MIRRSQLDTFLRIQLCKFVYSMAPGMVQLCVIDCFLVEKLVSSDVWFYTIFFFFLNSKDIWVEEDVPMSGNQVADTYIHVLVFNMFWPQVWWTSSHLKLSSLIHIGPLTLNQIQINRRHLDPRVANDSNFLL